MTAAPIVKWAGGKRDLAPLIAPLVVERLTGRYIEPFCGGAAVALALGAKSATVSDVCRPLVWTYRAVARRPDLVARHLEMLFGAHSGETYPDVRRRYNAGSWVERRAEMAALFIYLNKAGFNGLYRTNRRGEFNVPAGRKRRGPSTPTPKDLHVFAAAAAGWSLRCGDFEEVVESAAAGDVVYADPPYDGTFGYSSGFTAGDQARLAACLRRAARRGVGVVASNSNTPLVRRLYAWADVREIGERRRVAADPDRRSDAACVLAVRP